MGLTTKRIAAIKAPGRLRASAAGSMIGFWNLTSRACLRTSTTRCSPGLRRSRTFSLQWRSKTNASWIFKFERNGKQQMLGLGPLHTVTLADAREFARQARLSLLAGVNPVEDRKAKRTAAALEAAKAMTFQQATEAYYDQHANKWTNKKHREQFLETLPAYAFPVLGRIPVKDIDVSLVLKAIEPAWRIKTATVSRVRGRIESVLDWCKPRGYRSGDNPAAWSLLSQVRQDRQGEASRRSAVCRDTQLHGRD